MEGFLISSQLDKNMEKQEVPMAAMFVNGLG
jgi:hypothetical protein